MQIWHHAKLYGLELDGFVICEIIEQITKEKVNERWYLED